MNSCDNIREMISLMLDGGLSAGEEELVRGHIEHCGECKAMYEAFAAVSDAIKSDAAQVPACLHQGIMDKVRAFGKKPKKGLVLRLRPLLAAAACFVVVIGAVSAVNGGGFSAMDYAAESAVSGNAMSAPAAQESKDLRPESPMEESAEGIISDNSYSYGTEDPSSAAEMPYGLWDAELLSAEVITPEGRYAVSDPYELRDAIRCASGDLVYDAESMADGSIMLSFVTTEKTYEVDVWFKDGFAYVDSADLFITFWDDAVYCTVSTPEELLSIR